LSLMPRHGSRKQKLPGFCRPTPPSAGPPGTTTGSNPDNLTETAQPPFLGGPGENIDRPTDVYDPSIAVRRGLQ
jgi:hypothetical protein